jgi:hypothetical protein
MKQKEFPSKGDYFNLVKDDFKLIGETMDETEIANKSKDSHKRNIKTRISNAAFQYKQSQHTKVKDIIYEKLTTQEYMTSPLFTDMN